MLGDLLNGLGSAIGSGGAVAWLLAGTMLGLIVGVIPGLSGAVILSVVLVFVYHMSLQATLVFFLATHAAGFFSASLTSIFLNTPAHAEAVPVAFDGYPLAVKGQAGRALGISASATAIGAILGFAALVGIFQVADQISLLFHPPEYVALILLAMALVATMGVKRLSKGLISVCIGLLISTIGVSGITGASRFTFNQAYLLGGIPLAILSIGMFAMPQMMMVYGTASSVAKQDISGNAISAATAVRLGPRPYRQVMAGGLDAIRNWRILIQSTVIGVISGIIPGIGGFAANYLSYTSAQQLSSRKYRELFGTGLPRGIAAAEASNIPKEQGGLLTVFGLGLPHGTSSALFLVALTIQGLQPGIGFPSAHPEIIYESLWIILLAGIIGTGVAVVAAPLIVRGTRIPGPLLFPFVVSLCAIGAFIGYRSYTALVETAVFAVIGLVMRRLGYSLAAAIIGVVMGGVLEQNVYLVHNLYPGTSLFTKRPGADAIFVLLILVLLVAAVRLRRNRSKRQPPQFSVLELIADAAIVAIGGVMAYVASANYSSVNALMPVLVGSIAATVALYQLVRDGYTLYRHRVVAAATTGTADLGPAPQRPDGMLDGPVEEDILLATPARSVDHAVAATPGTPAAVATEAAERGAVATVEPVAGDPGSVPVAGGEMPAVRERSWARHGQYRREAVALAWIVGAMVLFYFFGFHIGVPVFAFFYGLMAVRRVIRRPLPRGVFALASAVVLFLTTSLLFHIVVVLETPKIDWFAHISLF